MTLISKAFKLKYYTYLNKTQAKTTRTRKLLTGLDVIVMENSSRLCIFVLLFCETLLVGSKSMASVLLYGVLLTTVLD